MDLAAIKALEADVLACIDAARDAAALEAVRVEWLGRKSGRITALMKEIPTLPAAERGPYGQAVNALKAAVTDRLDARKAVLEAVRPRGPTVDVTMPGRRPALGRLHPITQAAREMLEIFGRLGFEVVEGPEVEDEWHNFVGLNIPPAHPARDPLENYYLKDHVLLRTQTSTVQIRIMENRKPPVRVVAPGRVYRPDTVDAGHSNMFHQLEGLWVEEGVTFADLKSTLAMFARSFFGSERPDAVPAQLLPVHRAQRRDVHLVPAVRWRGLRRVQAYGLDRNPGLRHGGPERLPGRRVRSREGDGFCVRHGHRPAGDAEIRNPRHPPPVRKRLAVPPAVLVVRQS